MTKAKLPTKPPAGMTVEHFMSHMSVDKKVAAGKIRFILLKGELGSCVVTGEFDQAKLKETLVAFTSGN
jgi:3-dehydroquinate synthase